jgi:hypothetical protein
MSSERGALVHLVEYDVATDSYGHGCRIEPRGALCAKCRIVKPGWFPKQPSSVSLYLLAETLTAPFVGMPILHEALVEELTQSWPSARFVRCRSAEGSPLRVGERYFAVSLPRKNEILMLYPAGEVRACSVCQREVCSMGPGAKDPYVVLSAEQEDEVAFCTRHGDLLVNPPLRESISRLGMGTIGWFTVPVFSERLSQHSRPDGGADAAARRGSSG